MVINNISLDRVQTNPEFNFKNNITDETSIDEITPYHNVGHSCNYYEQSEFQDHFNNMDKQVSFLSQNIRSLPGKWTEFSQLISEVNNGSFHFSVIALQEIWNVPKGTSYNLPGYKPFHFWALKVSCCLQYLDSLALSIM